MPACPLRPADVPARAEDEVLYSRLMTLGGQSGSTNGASFLDLVKTTHKGQRNVDQVVVVTDPYLLAEGADRTGWQGVLDYLDCLGPHHLGNEPHFGAWAEIVALAYPSPAVQRVLRTTRITQLPRLVITMP